MSAAPDAGLWAFSLGIYARPGVAAACLDLQARFGADVNLLLAAAWTGASGRGRLTASDLDLLVAAARPLHAEVVKPLRAARVALKPLAAADARLEPLRASIKRAELDAERAEQAALEAVLAPRPAAGLPGRRAADALANMSAYLTHLGAPGSESRSGPVAAIAGAIAGESTS